MFYVLFKLFFLMVSDILDLFLCYEVIGWVQH